MLAPDLDFLELAQRPQAHVEDRLGLHVGELERLHQHRLGLVLGADDADHLVEVEVGDQVAVEHLQPVADLLQPEVGAADQHLAAVRQPLVQHLAEAHHPGHDALRQDVEVERDARLEIGQPEQRLHHQRRIDRAALRLDDDADVLGQLVADVGDQRQLLGLHQLGDLLDQPRLLHLVGDFGDDDRPGAAPLVLLRPAGAHAERAAPGPVGLDDVRFRLDDDAAGREIRPLDEVDQRVDARLRRLDQMQRRVAELGDVVRRDVGRHADGDARRAVGEQVGEGAGQHHRLAVGAVIGRAEVDRVLVDAVEQQPRDLGHARFGVAHGGGVIAVDVAEIALPVDQRIADREILGEAHQRVVDRLVAMRMEIAHHVADDLGRLLERRSPGRAAAGACRTGCAGGPASARRARSGSARFVIVESA